MSKGPLSGSYFFATITDPIMRKNKEVFDMFKNIAIFTGGLALGAYVMYNRLFKSVVKVALDVKSKKNEEEKGENVKDEK